MYPSVAGLQSQLLSLCLCYVWSCIMTHKLDFFLVCFLGCLKTYAHICVRLSSMGKKVPFTCPETWQYGTAPGHNFPLEQLDVKTCWGISNYTPCLFLGKWSPSISVGCYPEITFKTKIPKCNTYISLSPIIIYGYSGIGLGSYKLISQISPKVCWSILPILYLLLQKKTRSPERLWNPNPTVTLIWTRSSLSCFYHPTFWFWNVTGNFFSYVSIIYLTPVPIL